MLNLTKEQRAILIDENGSRRFRLFSSVARFGSPFIVYEKAIINGVVNSFAYQLDRIQDALGFSPVEVGNDDPDEHPTGDFRRYSSGGYSALIRFLKK